MNSVIKSVNNIQTKLMTWGEPFDSFNQEDVIICITGNPGVPDFYTDFASELYKQLLMPICVIGHAGHYDLFKGSEKIPNNEEFYNLQVQVEHKLDLIQKYINPKRNIHLIGHSIGAWMIVELLQKNDHLMERVSSVNLLFPTLQKMADTPNGRFINNIFRRRHTLILSLIRLLYLFPEFILYVFVYLYLIVKCLPLRYNNSILKLIKPLVIKNILLLAYDEMDNVKMLNNNGLAKIKHLTNVIYACNDGWAPLELMDDLKKFEPCLKMTLTDKIEHAFVLKSSEPVANMVSDFIKLKINC